MQDNVSEYAYGTEGGNKYFKALFKPRTDIKEFSILSNCIKNSFEDISCSLLPSPSMIVHYLFTYNKVCLNFSNFIF